MREHVARLEGPARERRGRPREEPILAFRDVRLSFDRPILKGVSFDLAQGTTKVILGGSGSGKTTILRLILGLLKPDAGSITVLGCEVGGLTEDEMRDIRLKVGMVFQEGALFDSLTVRENVGYRLYEESDMPVAAVGQRVEEVLGFVGLAEFIDRMPSELSGGQRRRVAIARAMATKPHLLLFDDPTTGLDPVIATTVDDEIVKLRDLEHVTSILVTHQIRDAFYVATHEAVHRNGRMQIVPSGVERARFMVLHEGRIYFEGTGAELLASQDRYLREFLFMTLPPW